MLRFHGIWAVGLAISALLSSNGCSTSGKADSQSAGAASESRSALTEQPQNTNERPTKSVMVNPKFPPDSLFGIWANDPQGPSASFELTGEFYFVADYDGDGNMPYIIRGDSIRVFYPDYVSNGKILRASSDTLQITWEGTDIATTYVRWEN